VLLAVFAAAASVVLADAPARGPGFPASNPPIRTRPDWIRVPTLDDIAEFYPRGALARGLEGRVVLDCRVSVAGRLKDCSVLEDAPSGAGFGEAALQIAPLVVVRPGTIDGAPIVDEPVRVPLAFRLPGGPLPGLEGSLRCHGLLTAHLALSPDDSRLAQAASLAAERADLLMTDAGVDAEARMRRLEAARADAPRPQRAGATRDPCFLAFLQ
jgi:TonB family protein